MEHECLTCPQLLSKSALCEVLKDRCIETPNYELMDKTKLIEIFKRVAQPMSQRIYNEDRPLGKQLQHLRSLRNIATAHHDQNTNFSTSSEMSMISSDSARLKSPINDNKIIQKRIRLSGADQVDTHMDYSHDVKRKCQASPYSDLNKRQKITWP